MFKFILIIVIACAIYFLWQHVQKLKTQANKENTDNVKPMKPCDYCHVYIAQEDAIKGANGQWYCCAEHAQKAVK